MLPTAAHPVGVRTDRRIEAFQLAGEHGPSAVARFLPPPGDPDYLPVLTALVRADQAHFRRRGQDVSLSDYREHFPTLYFDDEADDTPLPTALVHVDRGPDVRPPAADSGLAAVPFPKPGDEFAGFALVEELGRGAFGRVYLAREHRLADRPVALKVTTKANNEPKRLARLQHTNIVPIHTAFQSGLHHVVQMPFFGRQTLADLIDHVRATNQFPKVSGAVFTSTVARADTSGGGSGKKSAPADDSAVTLDARADRTVGGSGSGTRLAPRPVPDAHPLRAQFAGKSYVDAVLWVGTRLADGLAHAHARDILHLDLKPQNILMADDGQPMLLDFNLAFDTANKDRDRVGGTWPYMAPEQIREYASEDSGATVDARSDLFGLGVILFELLTLRHPFPAVRGGTGGLAQAVAERTADAPRLRDLNPAVTPAVEAIVRKLLAGDPAARYQSAADVRDDLQRQQDHLPLAHAADTSLVERAGKWHRRHPNAVPYIAAGLLAAAVLGTGLLMASWWRDRVAASALATAEDATTTTAALRIDLASLSDTAVRDAALAKADGLMARYGVGTRANWAADLKPLPADRRAAVREALGEAALLAAHAEWVGGRRKPAADKAAAADRAARWNRTAEDCFDPAAIPAVLWEQRLELAAETGDRALAATVPDVLGGGPATAVDLYVTAARRFADDKTAEAAELLTALTDTHPRHYGGHFLIACCYQRAGKLALAAERFQVAKPLAPAGDPRPAYNRGLALLILHDLDAAEKEFTAALARDPGWANAYWHRGSVRKKKGDLRAAEADLTAALAKGAAPLPVLWHRSGVYADQRAAAKAADDAAGERRAALAADADLAAIDAAVPATELDYVARGLRWLEADAERALADFEAAARINPDYLPALQNQAHVLADKLHDQPAALAAQTRAVQAHPNLANARSGRAVLLARVGRRDEAHAEARRATLGATDARVYYHAANAFALTAATHPADRATAGRYLRQAIDRGFRNLAVLEGDPDMANVRDTADYKEAVAVLRTLAAK